MTSRQNGIVLSCLGFLGIASVFLLFLLSDNLNHRRNSFIRLFPPHPVDLPSKLDIKYNSFYIAGATSSHIYLGSQTAPFRLLKIDSSLGSALEVNIRPDEIKKLKWRNPRIAVDSPNFFIMDGVLPAIFKGNLTTWEPQRFQFDSAYFIESVPISNASFGLRSMSSRTNSYILGKEAFTPFSTTFNDALLQKQIDGIFCTDGMLHYNRALGYLTYVYYYRNQFICMDTNMNLIYRGNTIDTISRAKIKVAQVNSTLTLSAPPLIVNKESCVSGNWLFVNSNLLAENEDAELFKSASVIDVYDLRNNTYKFSFYLLNTDSKKIRTFRVYNNMLIALYDHFILKYELVPKYFISSE
ncbi:hypothetical protein KK083_29395 [Fulvivirgaceae bacterium PWU4]|uniref:Uncharacterized protein n=1 Tax=Chryseosolibacter histidini TaxID=2782349 RepID=A0AAP2DT51_9BACT|nr:hypothetical protein [Chryseosolibacter histidini]MBT1701044.1 hypothetical protein [Chryseosolibacter histidini]